MTEDPLEAMRAQVREGKSGRVIRKKWTPPQPEDFALGAVLTFDQTLTKTGWVMLRHSPEEGLHILAGGLLRAKYPPSLTGFEQTFAKAESMGRQVEMVVRAWRGAARVIVHEMPAVAGHRLESSYMAAREIRRANNVYLPIPVQMISRLSTYGTIVGDPLAPKSQMTEAVNRLIPPSQRIASHWNQDVHDAAGLGLKYLYDRKRQEDGNGH